MRVIFMGTPDFAVPTLMNLANNRKHHVIRVVTSVDKPRGRGRKLLPSPIKSCALTLNIPVIQPQNLKDHNFIEQIRSLAPDVFVVVAFRILPIELFSIPPYGAINLHASLLPKYRGPAPIQWTLINGETKTGVTTFQIDADIDTGNILMQKEVQIHRNETAGELSLRLAEIGAKLIAETLDRLESGMVMPRKQHLLEHSHAPKITPDLLHIDWHKPAHDIVNIIRAFSPSPAACTSYKNNRLKIFRAKALQEADKNEVPGRILKANPKDGLQVKAGTGAVEIITIQREGKRQMSAGELLRGMKIVEGDILQ